MTDQELKKEQFIAKAMENKNKFEIHKRLIEKYLCIGGKMYIKDLKVFAERQVVDNHLLLNLMEYAENFAKEYSELQRLSQAECALPKEQKERYDKELDSDNWKKYSKIFQLFDTDSNQAVP